MEIKSIKEIKNIGTFKNFNNGRQLRFEKINFIYGLNTFGKTTLTDIFQSLKNDDAKIIQSRETIPKEQNTNQSVSISVKNEQKEKELKFSNNTWDKNQLAKNLEIFGTDFIHKNLFTGLTIERSNQENFTQFIMGEEGADIAKKIANDKKTLRNQKSNLNTQVPNFVKHKSNQDIIKFIQYDISQLDKKEIDKDLIEKKKEKQDEEYRLQNPKTITDLINIADYSIPKSNTLEYLTNINQTLQKNYSNIKDEILKNIDNHINDNFNNKENSQDWIRQGFNNCSDKQGDCIFCGQDLKNANHLINSYSAYFDEEYNKFIEDIESKLKLNFESLQKENFSEISKLNKNLALAMKFKNFNSDKKFHTQLSELENNILALAKQEEHLNELIGLTLDQIKNSIEIKNKKPHTQVKSVENINIIQALSKYELSLAEIKKLIYTIRISIESFKSQYQDTNTIEELIKKLSQKISELEYIKARIEQNTSCNNYKNSESSIEDLTNSIKIQEASLDLNQTNYLTKYFEEINQLFKKFGSNNFLLSKKESKKGDMPVYSLQVKFHNKKISSNDIKTVFSESDKRALALSVFWAKINLNPQKDKKQLIVVLDDPVTSFDDNRILNTITLFKESISELSQIFIFTHYPNFIRSFCERTKEVEITTKFFKLDKNQTTSLLQAESRSTFTASEYEKVFSKIYGFIDREHNNCIKNDLRLFLESLYLPTVFAQNIKEIQQNNSDISSLKKLINEVFVNDGDTKNKFQSFRSSLNPDHHTYTLNTGEEDIRNFAKEMMDFLYSFEFKKS